MEITVRKFIEQVEAADFQTALLTADKQPLATLDVPILLKSSVERFCDLVQKNPLVQVTLLIPLVSENGVVSEVKVQLESSVINLPYHNINRVANFFSDEEQTTSLNLYVTVVSDQLPSALHIDFVESLDDTIANPAAATTIAAAKVVAQLMFIARKLDEPEAETKKTAEKK